MNWQIFSSFIAGLYALFLGFFVLLKNKQNINIVRIFFLMNISITCWNFADIAIVSSPNVEYALFFNKLSYIGAFFIASFFSKIVFILLRLDEKYFYKIFFRLSILSAVVFSIISISSSLFLKSVQINPFKEETGVLYPLFIISFLGQLIFSLAILFKRFLLEKSGVLKNQFRYVFFALFAGFVAVVLYFISLSLPNFPILHYLVEMIYLSIFAYAIAAHNLMDIDLAWRKALREIFYYAFLCCYIIFFIYFLNSHHLSNAQEVIIVFIASIFFLGISNKLKFKLHNLFLGKYKKVWDKLKQIASIKGNYYDMKNVVDILVMDIPSALGLKNATYYYLPETQQKYVVYQTTLKEKLDDILFDSKLVFELMHKRKYLYLNELENKELIFVFEKLQIDLCYPIFFQDALVAILTYGKKNNEGVFHKEDLELLTETIFRAEEQINNIIKINHISSNYAEEILKMYKNNNQRMLLNETKRLSEFRDVGLLCEHSKKVIQRLLNVRKVDMYLCDSENESLYRSISDKNKIIDEKNYLIKYLVQTNEIVGTADLKKWADETRSVDFQEAAETAESFKSKFIIPLTDRKLLGFFTIDDKLENFEYTQDDFVFLSVIKNTLEITLRNIYLNEKSQRDPLTQLYNRYFLNVLLEEEIIQGLRDCIPVSYLMIDGDNFKWFNDTHGHDAGDKVLVEISSCIKELIRPSDELCRYGGEEFAVICPGTGNEGAILLGERINRELKKNVKIVELTKLYERAITVSVGVSTFYNKDSKTNYTNQEVIDYGTYLQKKADEAMYEAKQKGKDRVVSSGEFESIE